jgi:hypothetical protein
MKIKNGSTSEVKIRGDNDGGTPENARQVMQDMTLELCKSARECQSDLVSVVELEALLADATVKRHSWVQETNLGGARAGRSLVHDDEPVHHAKDGETGNESKDCDKQPVLGEPEDNLDVGPVPAVSKVVGEETPRVVVVLIGEKNAHALVADGAGVVIMSPDKTEEERSSGGHDSDVWQRPATVVLGQGINGLEEEGMAGDCAHNIV